jgi:hypothetical protein
MGSIDHHACVLHRTKLVPSTRMQPTAPRAATNAQVAGGEPDDREAGVLAAKVQSRNRKMAANPHHAAYIYIATAAGVAD